VDAVSVVVCAVELLKVSEDEERLHVAGLEAPEGAVTEQLRFIVPVNELPGVAVMVEVPDAPVLTVMLPLLESEKLLLLPFGFCQKSPHPARSKAAAGNAHAHFPIFIAAPLAPYSGCAVSGTRFQGNACWRLLSCCRQAHAHPSANIMVDAI
jgi:hypothetical protein